LDSEVQAPVPRDWVDGESAESALLPSGPHSHLGFQREHSGRQSALIASRLDSGRCRLDVETDGKIRTTNSATLFDTYRDPVTLELFEFLLWGIRRSVVRKHDQASHHEDRGSYHVQSPFCLQNPAR